MARPKLALEFLQSLVGHKGDDCVRWPFSCESNGRGHLGYNGKIVRAHRLLCEMVKGPPPSPMHHAAHSCGNGHLACVNPNHLSWKTQAENERDKKAHGTARGGNGHVPSRLTPAQISDIRAKKNVVSAYKLAKQYGLSRAGIRYWQSTTHTPMALPAA